MGVLTRAYLDDLIAERAERRKREQLEALKALKFAAAWKLTSFTTPRQSQIANDNARHKVLIAGRRAGKTYYEQLIAIEYALRTPGVTVVYVSTTIKRARATIWRGKKGLVRLAAPFGGKANSGTGEIVFPNESRIVVTGCESQTMADDLRGRPSVALWIIDECQDWDDDLLEYFYEQVVEYSFLDVKADTILSGTGSRPRGWWFKQATEEEDGKTVHCWTAFDNPELAEGEAQALIERKCKRRGVTIDDPSIRREFFAEFRDDGSRQIVVVDKARVVMPELPKLPDGTVWRFVIGVDFGTVDAAAVVVFAFSKEHPDVYIVHAKKKRGMGASKQLEWVKAEIARFRALGKLSAVVGDPGGPGKAILTDLQEAAELQSVEIGNAQKLHKVAHAIFMRDDFNTAYVRVVGHPVFVSDVTTGGHVSPTEDFTEWFVEDMQTPEWEPDALGEEIAGHCPDAFDACLYAHRKVRTLHSFKPTPPVNDADTRWRERTGKAA